MTIVALVGATGNFGHKLLPALEEDTRISKIHSLSRKAGQESVSGKVINFKVNYADPKALEDALEGCDVLINAMGTNGDYEQNKVALVDVAAKVGVKLYIPR
jgi:aspartate-semialdehyde dehydrogenase